MQLLFMSHPVDSADT